MIIVSLFGGLVSQIRAFYMGYKLSRKFQDALVLDLSSYYNGYYRPYVLDFLKIPDCQRIAIRGELSSRVKKIERLYGQSLHVIENGEELEKTYKEYITSQIYYLVNDCCNYDRFCRKHPEFYFRYIGDDLVTNGIMNMIQIENSNAYLADFESDTANYERVGVHIRLRDFIQVGWMTEQDYDFYKAAVVWFRQKVANPLFIIFSDDMDEARKILGIADDIYYMENTCVPQNDIEQLICFSKCKHKILSKKSGFSLFAATISQNKWKAEGYTLIIENMNLAETAGEREYVDYNFNKNPISRWEDSLYNCVSLSKDEIEKLSALYRKNDSGGNRNYNIPVISDESRGNKDIFVFLTLQTFSQTRITGMERMARIFAKENEVHFVGERNNSNSFIGTGFQNTLQKAHQAEDINGCLFGYTLYPYAELNKNNNYTDFIRYLCNDSAEKCCYVIVRKRQSLPPLEYPRIGQEKYIFIDFTDEFEVEDWRGISEEDLAYMYENADLVITFQKAVCEQYNKIRSRFVYVDLSRFYPDIKVWDKRIENLDEINKCEDSLYQYIYELIRSFFLEE